MSNQASPSDMFRADVDAFLARTGMKASIFGLTFAGDPNFLASPAREYRWATMQTIRAKMADHEAAQ